MPSCYYYDEQHNRCKCYVNESLDELLAENAKLRELVDGCAVLLTDRDFLHWPELCEEVLGGMRELGVEVPDV